MDLRDEEKPNYILTHEFIHIKRFDYAWKLLFAAAVCVHWFNPLVWLMYILANRDIELACDEKVLQIFGRKSRASYGLTLRHKELLRLGQLLRSCWCSVR